MVVAAAVVAVASWGFVGGTVACLGCRPNVVVVAAVGAASCLVASFFVVVAVAASCPANDVVVAVASFEEAYLIVAWQTRRGNSVVHFA